MSYCKNCKISVKDDWKYCPLCGTPFAPENADNIPGSFPNFSLRFNRKKINRILSMFSLLAIILYFITQWVWQFGFFGLEYVLFGLMITWLTILILVHKRRNIFKGIIYLLILFSLISLYFDYRSGAVGWSFTFAIPILSIATLFAMLISIQLVSLKTEDYVLYLQLAAILGAIPLVFLIMDWAAHPLPSLISVVLSIVVFITTFIKHRNKINSELKKRFHV